MRETNPDDKYFVKPDVQHAAGLGKGLNSRRGWDPWLRLSPGSPAPQSCTDAFSERIVLQCNKAIKAKNVLETRGTDIHRGSEMPAPVIPG